ncbi:MAG: hypothetical protein ACXAB9_13045 [Candidatus Thorarchaeota archaeon]|jgi:hypothetical protein
MSPEELSAYLEVIKSFTEPAAQMVFETTVRSVFVESLLWLVVVLVAEVVCLGVVVTLFRSYGEMKSALRFSYDEDAAHCLWWLAGIIAVVIMVLLLFSVPSTVTNIMVPEAKAIQILIWR